MPHEKSWIHVCSLNSQSPLRHRVQGLKASGVCWKVWLFKNTVWILFCCPLQGSAIGRIKAMTANTIHWDFHKAMWSILLESMVVVVHWEPETVFLWLGVQFYTYLCISNSHLLFFPHFYQGKSVIYSTPTHFIQKRKAMDRKWMNHHSAYIHGKQRLFDV